MIELKQGDMFAEPAQILVNTVNCVGAMGKGIAKQFKFRFPAMFEDYHQACLRGEIKPGKITTWDAVANTIVNFATKQDWRNDSKLEWIESGLQALRSYLEPLGPVTVALPALGCGNGGLDWADVLPLIKQYLDDLQAIVRVYQPVTVVPAEDPPFALEGSVIVPEEAKEPAKAKPKKAKKRPSDFEIVRTILQRSHERKLSYLLNNVGADSDLLVLCSANESEFTYGSPDISLALFEFTDPEVSDLVSSVMSKLKGTQYSPDHQLIVNLRDQMSELSRTKGEKLDVEFEENEAGSVWVVKQDVKGKERVQYFVKAIDSLFHVQVVTQWCEQYRPLLTTTDPHHVYYPYQHPDGDTGVVITLPPPEPNHPMRIWYPHGFRAMVTRGQDVLVDKCLIDFPYPVIKAELILFQDNSVSCQIAHRLEGTGWRMVLVRPNAVLFPAHDIPLSTQGSHHL